MADLFKKKNGNGKKGFDLKDPFMNKDGVRTFELTEKKKKKNGKHPFGELF